jgi:tRNA A-37 threonylcarbamoyl transferase component Bud32
MQTICPDRTHWQELLDGALPDDRQGVLAAHLDACLSCRQTLEELAGGSDTLGLTARRLEQPSGQTGPALGRALDDLYGLPRSGASAALAGSDAGATLDFLDPPQEPEHLGRLGRYEVTAVVGWGGMGVVLRAFDATLRRTVALKVIAPRLASNPTARKRFLREAQAAAAIRHEHVVTIHAVEETKSLPYIVMEYVPGLSLQQFISRTGPLPLAQIVPIGQQVAAGLAAAHALDVTHRDIKPANILLENGGAVSGGARDHSPLAAHHSPLRVKITDFGLAQAANEVRLTQHGVLLGTPEYMAPEQARGEALDHRADLFSLGAVLYTMCTGRPPFRAGSILGLLRLIAEEAPRPIHELNPQIPDWLTAIVEKLLAKAPEDRFQSAAEVASLLDRRLLAPSQTPAPAPVSPAAQAPPTPVPTTLWRPIAIGALMLSLVGGICLLTTILGVAAFLFVPWRGKDVQDGALEGRQEADAGRPQKQPLAPAEVPRPRDPKLQLTLVALKGANSLTRLEAATRLEQMQPIAEERAAVTGALEPLLNDPDHFTRQAMIRALGVWGTRENIPALVKMFEHPDPHTRGSAIVALGNIKDERSAEAIAGRLEDALNRRVASDTLQKMGRLAESAAARMVDHQDWMIRLEVCKILKVIGTKKSIPALETAVKDSNGIVVGEAKAALQVLQAREPK